MIQRLRVPLGFAVALPVLFYLARPSSSSILIGLPIAIAGVVFRGLSAAVIKKNSVLATTGPYAWTRNPLYFGTFLLVVGFAVMCANLYAAVLLGAVFMLVYPRVIRKEEAELEKIFGKEFRTYAARVPRFFPRPRRFNGSFSIAQYMANREYNASLGLIGAVAILVLKWRGVF